MIKIFFIVLLAVSISAFGYAPAYADSVDAVVVEGDHCVVSEAASGVGVPLMTEDTYKVQANKNIVEAVCHFNIPEGATKPKRALTNKNLNCKITPKDGPDFMADDAHVVVTPGGQAVLTCKYNP